MNKYITKDNVFIAIVIIAFVIFYVLAGTDEYLTMISM